MERHELIARVENVYKNSFNLTHHAAIDIAGDLVAGILLDRIMFWFAPSRTGESKLRVFKDGHYWLAKGRTDWEDEIKISPKQYDRAAKILVDLKLIFVDKFKFNGAPMIHIRPNYETYNKSLNAWKANVAKQILEGVKSNFTDGEKPTAPTDEGSFLDGIDFDFPERSNSNFPEGENPNSPNGKNEFDERGKSLTGNTTGGTTEGTTGDINNSAGQSPAPENVPHEDQEKKAKKRSIPKPKIDEEFNILWELYPTGRKQGKLKAKEAYTKARNEGVSFDTIKEGLEGYNQHIKINHISTKYIKLAQTWFNNRSWEDEYDSYNNNGGGRNGSNGINYATHSKPGEVYGNFIG